MLLFPVKTKIIQNSNNSLKTYVKEEPFCAGVQFAWFLQAAKFSDCFSKFYLFIYFATIFTLPINVIYNYIEYMGL